MGDIMNKQHVSDSELAKAIESSPFHQAMLHSDDSSIARFGAEFEHIADEFREWVDEEAPTYVLNREPRKSQTYDPYAKELESIFGPLERAWGVSGSRYN